MSKCHWQFFWVFSVNFSFWTVFEFLIVFLCFFIFLCFVFLCFSMFLCRNAFVCFSKFFVCWTVFSTLFTVSLSVFFLMSSLCVAHSEGHRQCEALCRRMNSLCVRNDAKRMCFYLQPLSCSVARGSTLRNPLDGRSGWMVHSESDTPKSLTHSLTHSKWRSA